MAKFEVGDRVQMSGVPFVVEVLELDVCAEGEACEFGPEVFRFHDPVTGRTDWMHTSEFVAVPGGR